MQQNLQLYSQIINKLFMKKISLLLISFFVAGTAILIQACCKGYCVKHEMQLQFIGFDRQEVDTLLLIKYEPGNLFTGKIDSFLIDPLAIGQDTLHGYLRDIDPEKDWEIKLPALNSTYRISDIQTTSERCECSRSSRRVISAYRLQQGSVVYGEYVELRK